MPMGLSSAGAGPGGGAGLSMPSIGGKNYYQQALGFSMGNYQNILGGYANQMNNLQSGLGSIQQGYSGLYQGVKDTLGLGGNGWGVATPAANAISEQFAKSRGKITQGMINSGLGNSTVTANLQNQNSLMAGRAFGELGNQLAGTAAGYQASIGQAQLGAAQQGLGMQTNFASGMLGDLSRYSLPTPGAYGALGDFPGGGGSGGGSRGGGGGGSGGSSGYGNTFQHGALPYGNPGMGYAGAYSQPSFYNTNQMGAGSSFGGYGGYTGEGNEIGGYGGGTAEGWNQGSGEGGDSYWDDQWAQAG